MSEACKHKREVFEYLETVKVERYLDGKRFNDELFSILKCVDCERIIKKEL